MGVKDLKKKYVQSSEVYVVEGKEETVIYEVRSTVIPNGA
jgi:hypothetical protein